MYASDVNSNVWITQKTRQQIRGPFFTLLQYQTTLHPAHRTSFRWLLAETPPAEALLSSSPCSSRVSLKHAEQTDGSEASLTT